MGAFQGVKVFSATMIADRQVLGEKVTEWIHDHPELEVVDMVVSQSSDAKFHCIAITLFYNRKEAARARLAKTGS
jgi:hypothetical protein